MRTNRIRCDFPLIDPAHQALQFHTDSVKRRDQDMTLTSHGRLIWHGYVSKVLPGPPRDIDFGLDGDFVMYAEPEEGGPLVYYRVFLVEGQVTWIRPCNRLGIMGARRLLPTRKPRMREDTQLRQCPTCLGVLRKLGSRLSGGRVGF